MRKFGLIALLSLVVSAAAAQAPANGGNRAQVQAHTMSPSYSHQYCAGFITNQEIARSNFVSGGMESHDTIRFATGDLVFLAGDVLQEGAQFAVLRHTRDPNAREAFRGQHGMIRGLGETYAELGRVRVVAVQGQNAIAQVDYSCDAIIPGDIVVPFAEKPEVKVPPTTSFNRFALQAPKVSARVVMARDFAVFAGTGQIVYLSAGADQGVRVGDTFRAVRGYEVGSVMNVDTLSAKATEEEPTQVKSTHKVSPDQLPRRIVGEMVVVNVTPTSSTAMITFAAEPVNVGDAAEIHQSQ